MLSFGYLFNIQDQVKLDKKIKISIVEDNPKIRETFSESY